MPDFDNTNKGALWKVENPESAKHPNFKGSINVGGTEYWVSAWTTRNPEGKRPHIRLAVTRKEDQGAYDGHVGDSDFPF